MAVESDLPRADRFIEITRSRIVEARSIDLKNIRSGTFPMYVSLTQAQATKQRKFIVPRGKTLRIKGFRPHLRIVVPSAETITNLGTLAGAGSVFTTGQIADRIFGKGQNCRLGLRMTYNDIPFFDSRVVALSQFMSFMSAKPVGFYDFPAVIRGGTTIELNATLKEAAAAGSATEYGLLLVGALVAES